MNSLIRPFGVALALCGVALAGCKAVTDAHDTNYAVAPVPTVVLQGTILGLGSKRSVTLENNGDSAGAIGFIAADPAVATAGPPPVPFSFGAVPQGSVYNITVKQNPFAKICTVSGGSGTITTAADLAAHPITVTCVNDPAVPRYDLTVNLPNDPNAFSALPSATVSVKTEDQIYAKTVTSGQLAVTFSGILFNAASTVPKQDFTYTVSGSVKEADGTTDKCVVTSPTGTNPAGNIATPRIGTSAAQTVSACKFTISGSVAYSVPPPGTTAPSMPSGGLMLDVRDLQGNVLATQNVTAYGAFTVGGSNPTLFPSNVSSVYDVAISQQPTGQTCILADGGGANLYTGTTTNNPVSVTSTGTANPSNTATLILGSRLQVFCRANPVASKQLKGTFRLTSVTWTPNINAPAPVTSTWVDDLSVQNTASSNMLTFFDDGTFLYGTHATTTQVEQGFYDYDATAQTLRFTLITDSNMGATYPGTFSPTNPFPNTSVGSFLATTTNGLSATPGKIVSTGVTVPASGAGSPTGPGGTPPGILHAAMTGVALGTATVKISDTVSQTVRTISGTFGADANASTSTTVNPNAVNGTTQYPNISQRLAWVLTEPKSIDNEMTGAWISQDHRRFWVWDYSTYYGTHVGVEGGAASMNDACFTTEDLHASSGIYTRRGTITQCIAFGRLSAAQAAAGVYAYVGTLNPCR